MNRNLRLAACLLASTLYLGLAKPCLAQHDVLTQRYDGNRTGATTVETVLNHANVDKDHFGKLMAVPVDGVVSAQPLYLHGVKVPGKGLRNLLFVVTLNNYVYAIDTNIAGTPNDRIVWKTSVGELLYFPPDTYEEGILSTPVIDPATRTIYVASTRQRKGGWGFQLHALDVATGAEKLDGPVWIDGHVPGTGPDSEGGVMTFKAVQHQQRPGLALTHGTVYVGFGAYVEPAPRPDFLWHGWMFAFNASTLKQVGILCTTPDGHCDAGESVRRGDSSGGSFWLSGMAPAYDASGDIYAETGNGYFNADQAGHCYGNSLVKLHLDQTGLHVADYFAPHAERALSDVDKEMGSTSPILVPNSDLLVGGGKGGSVYIIDRRSLGHHLPDADTQIVQEWDTKGGIFAATCFWNNTLFTWTGSDPLSAYALSSGRFAQPAAVVGTIPDKFPWNGPADPYEALSISSNGNDPASAILWATAFSPIDKAPDWATVTLYALDATDISKTLWTSDNIRARDLMKGFIPKWVPPVVADGCVYTVAQTDQRASTVYMYGLLPVAR